MGAVRCGRGSWVSVTDSSEMKGNELIEEEWEGKKEQGPKVGGRGGKILCVIYSQCMKVKEDNKLEEGGPRRQEIEKASDNR